MQIMLVELLSLLYIILIFVAFAVSVFILAVILAAADIPWFKQLPDEKEPKS